MKLFGYNKGEIMHRTAGDGLVTGNTKYETGVNLYADEDPGVRDATQARHEEANSWQEEICNVIEGEGLALHSPAEAPATMDQLEIAINQKVSRESGYRTVADANLQSQINALNSSSIANVSGVSGTGVTGALNTLDGIIANYLPRGYLSGLNIVCDSTGTADTWVDIEVGECIDATNAYKIGIASQLRKRIDAGWVAGDDVGGWAGSTGSPRTGMYHYAFVIYNTATGLSEFGFDDNPEASNLLTVSGYNRYRRVGAFYVQSGTPDTVRGFRQRGNWFYHYDTHLTETLDLNTGSSGFKTGALIISPNPDAAFGNRAVIGIDILNVKMGLGAPDSNLVYATVWPYGGSGPDIDGSSTYWDAARNSGSIPYMTTMVDKPFMDAANPHGTFMVLTDTTPASACDIVCYCYGYEDSRGQTK